MEKSIRRKLGIISYSDSEGGAAIAAKRLYEALSEYSTNFEVQFLVYKKNSSISIQITPFNRMIFRILERIEGFLKYLILKERSQTSYFLINNPFWHIELILRRYDVINYHWTGGFLFNKQYLNSSKVYWTLHDMNPFTGGCHYNNTCRQFEANCEECYLLKKKYTGLGKDLFRHKLQKQAQPIHFIALSKWIGNELIKSAFYKRNKHQINYLPNTIDCRKFKPYSIEYKTYDVLFICSDLTDSRKGGFYVDYVIRSNPKLKFVTIGANTPKKFKNYPNVVCLGKIDKEEELIKIYNFSRLTFLPSLQENLSNVILESLSCGTPVVGFNIGGNKDLIKYNYLGKLASRINQDEVNDCIKQVLGQSTNANRIHKFVKNSFSYEVMAKKYDQAFNKI